MTRELVTRDWLSRPIVRFEREMDALLRRFFGQEDGEWMVPTSEFNPRTNLAETETGYEVTVELPGMKAEEVNVEFKGDQLWITGERKEEKEEKCKTWHRVESHYGEFRRVFTLPGTVDQEKVEARFEDGVLRITIPKTEAAKPRHIEVKS